jgi:hypothetical protein
MITATSLGLFLVYRQPITQALFSKADYLPQVSLVPLIALSQASSI